MAIARRFVLRTHHALIKTISAVIGKVIVVIAIFIIVVIIINNNNSSFISTADNPQLIFYNKLLRRTAQIQSNTKNQLYEVLHPMRLYLAPSNISLCIVPLQSICGANNSLLPLSIILKSMTLSDVEWPISLHFALFHTKRQLSEPPVSNSPKLATDPYCQGQEYSPGSLIFTTRRYASALLAVIVCLSVCPSVRPSVCHKSELYKAG